MKLFGNSKQKAFGLDISDLAVKVMELSPKGRDFIPVAFAEAAMPQGLIVNHKIMDESKLSTAIQKAMQAAKHIGTNYVVVSIPESKSFVRVLQIPKMAEDEISGAIPFEVEQNIPVPIDLVYMDWQLLREGKENMDVLVMATPKDYVDSLVNTLKITDLVPVAFELESQAISRSLISKEDRFQVVLIADISSNATSFVIVDEGNVEYTSSIPIAGNSFTESIARNLGMQYADAEAAKREQGLVADIRKGNIRQAILPLLDNIIDEMRNVLKFHAEHSAKSQSGERLTKIILSGGSARLPGIADYIAARLNLISAKNSEQVVLGNPWINIADPARVKLPLSANEALSYCTAAGLAMRGMGLGL